MKWISIDSVGLPRSKLKYSGISEYLRLQGLSLDNRQSGVVSSTPSTNLTAKFERPKKRIFCSLLTIFLVEINTVMSIFSLPGSQPVAPMIWPRPIVEFKGRKERVLELFVLPYIYHPAFLRYPQQKLHHRYFSAYSGQQDPL